jgi:hypothetical protein
MKVMSAANVILPSKSRKPKPLMDSSIWMESDLANRSVMLRICVMRGHWLRSR